jgi:uncharacterized integral membrane protein (TIGR00697 family)
MKKNSDLFVVLSGIYVVALIISNVVSGKLILFGNYVLTAGIFLFPIVYILADIFPEVYGLEKTRKIIWLGFALNLFAVLFFAFALWLPFPDFWKNQEAFVTVLSFTPRLLLASFVAYLIGTNVNAWIMVKLKKLTNEKFLWVRTIGSTVAGESLDSVIFITIAFLGIVPIDQLPIMIISQAVFKILYETFATPLTYVVINFCKKYESKLEN